MSRLSRRKKMSRHQRNTERFDRSANNTDTPVDPLRIPESMSGRTLRTRTPKSNPHADENDSDPDDDKPLHLMVNETPPLRGRPSRQPTQFSDEHVSPTPAASSNTPTSSTRSCRTQKRPHYNEDTDEEDGHRNKRQTTQGRYV